MSAKTTGRTFFAALACVALLGPLTGCSDAASRSAARAWKAFEKGRKEQALALFRDAILKEPDNVPAHLAYQTAMINVGRYQDVKREYRDRLSGHPDQGSAYFLASFIEDDYVQAKKILREGLKVEPKNPWIVWLDGIHRVIDLTARGRWDQALKTLDDLPTPRLHPFYDHFLKSWIFLLQGRFPKALREADAAIRQNPFDPEGYLMRAGAHYHAARFDKSIEDLRKAAALGDFAAVHSSLGSEFWQQGKIEEAKEEFRSALKSPRDNVAGWACSVATAYSYLGDYRKVEAHAALALRLNPDDTCAKAFLVSSKLNQGKLDEAERLAHEILKQNPSDENGFYAMATVHGGRGRWAESAKSYGQALERNPNDYGLLIGRGLALISNGQCPEGEKDLQRARKLAPDSPDVDRALGACAMAHGSYKEALDLLNSVLRRIPDDPQSYALIGSTYVRMRRLKAGRTMYAKAILHAFTRQDKKSYKEMLAREIKASQASSEDIEAVEASSRNKIKNYPKDQQAKRTVFTKVKALDSDRALIYAAMGRLFLGAPWKAAKPITEPSQRITYIQAPQWSSDRKTLYYAGGDLLALDIAGQQVRTVIPRPPGNIRVFNGGGIPFLIASKIRVSPRLWLWLYRHSYSYMDRSIQNVRLSQDDHTLYFSVDISSEDSVAYQLESAQVDGSRRRVLYPYARKMWSFDYDRPLDKLVLWTSNGLFLLDPKTGREKRVSTEMSSGRDASFSRDGLELVWSSFESDAEPELNVLNLRTGRKRGLGVTGRYPAWSPDGRKIAYIYRAQELRILDLKAGSLRSVDGPWKPPQASEKARPTAYFDRAIWSPDSRFITYRYIKYPAVHKIEPPTMVVADLKRNEIWKAQGYNYISWAPDSGGR